MSIQDSGYTCLWVEFESLFIYILRYLLCSLTFNVAFCIWWILCGIVMLYYNILPYLLESQDKLLVVGLLLNNVMLYWCIDSIDIHYNIYMLVNYVTKLLYFFITLYIKVPLESNINVLTNHDIKCTFTLVCLFL